MRRPFMRALRMRSLATAPVIALVASNLVSALGLLFWGRHFYPVIVLYWLETLVIAGFSLLKLATNRSPEPWKLVQKAVLIPAFVLHFGIFISVHALIIVEGFGRPLAEKGELPAEALELTSDSAVFIALAFLAFSHGVSFVRNYVMGGEYRRLFLLELNSGPYPRVIFMQVFLIAGGILVFSFGLPVLAVVLLIVLKTGVDLVCHLREHRDGHSGTHERLEKFYAGLAAAEPATDGTVPDRGPRHRMPLGTLPGYQRDAAAEGRLSRLHGVTGCSACLAFPIGLVLLISGLSAAGVVGLVAGVVLLVATIAIARARRRASCAHCGREMVTIETEVDKENLSRLQRIAATTGGTRYHDKWFVCHECRRYHYAERASHSD